MFPKPHWSALEWLITLSFAPIQFPEVQLDEISKKYSVFSRNAAKKVSLKKRSISFKMVYHYAEEAVVLLAEGYYY